MVRVAQQEKIQFEFGLEQGLRFDGVGARAEDGHFEFVELLFCVTKLGRLDDSTGGVGFGEEEEENALALEVFERDGFVFVEWQAERGGLVAKLEHGNELSGSLPENGQEQTLRDFRGLYRSHGESAIEHLRFLARKKGSNAMSAALGG